MFKTGQYRELCAGRAGIPVHRVHQHGQCPKMAGLLPVHKCLWLLHSRGWFGGASALHPKATPGTPPRFCGFQMAHSDFHGDFGTAVKWTAGWELGSSLHVKGVNLKADFNGSAQTGYDTNALMDFGFHQKGWVCGTSRAPSGAAILVARANRPAR
jgi:hypothetical protein